MTGTTGLRDIDARLSEAREAWRSGRHDEAKRRWRMVVAAWPDVAAPYVNLAGAGEQGWPEGAARTLTVGDPVVARNLGVLAQQRGGSVLARRCLRRAAVLAPGDAATWGVLAKLPACHGHDADPIGWSLRATLAEPHVEARWIDLLSRLLRAKHQPMAAAWIGRMPIATEDGSAALLHLVAECLVESAEDEAAEPILVHLLRREPLNPRTHMRRALIERRRGNSEAAVRHGRRAVLAAPEVAGTLGAFGSELVRASRFEEAARLFRRLLRVDPERRQEAVENLGAALVKLNAEAEATALLRESLVRRPGVPGSYLNLSALALQTGVLGVAARQGSFALTTSPRLADAHYNLASVRRHQGAIDEARALLASAAAIEDRPMFHYVRSMLELGDGDPVDGVRRYHVRWTVPSFSASRKLGNTPTLPQPVWQGEPRPDATLAVWGEQGVGDELWFASYLGWAARRVGRVVLEVAENLAALAARSFPEIDVRARDAAGTEAAMAAADLQVPMGNLMALYGAGERPVPTGYLRPDPALVERLRQRYLAGRPGRRIVGISWRSVKPVPTRSFEAPISEWGPLFALEDAVFVALQYGDVSADARLVRQRFGRELICDPGIDAYRDLDAFAAQVAAMDVVASIANSTVSVAHGLGKPVQVVTRVVQDDWKYARGAPTTRWLPAARCFWQIDGRDWGTPIRELADAL